MEFPDALLYTREHEWIRVDGTTVTIGITDFAQDALGDVVYVAPAEIGVAVEVGANVAEVESTKSVSEIYAPMHGTVIARNELLDDQPELINEQPYGDGWIFQLELSDPTQLATLLDAATYSAEVA